VAASNEELGKSVLIHVGQLYRELLREINRRVDVTWTSAQLDLLALVYDRPGLSVGDAARALRLAPNTVSTLAQELVGGGWLEKVRDPSDRRIIRLQYTDRAREEIDAWRRHRGRLLDPLLDELSEDDREALRRAMPVLHDLYERLSSQGAAGDGERAAPHVRRRQDRG
jgi:DNA-binding MarR family transcriptional regulator